MKIRARIINPQIAIKLGLMQEVPIIRGGQGGQIKLYSAMGRKGIDKADKVFEIDTKERKQRIIYDKDKPQIHEDYKKQFKEIRKKNG